MCSYDYITKNIKFDFEKNQDILKLGKTGAIIREQNRIRLPCITRHNS